MSDNELPRRKQRGIIKSIERHKRRGIQPLSVSGGFKEISERNLEVEILDPVGYPCFPGSG